MDLLIFKYHLKLCSYKAYAYKKNKNKKHQSSQKTFTLESPHVLKLYFFEQSLAQMVMIWLKTGERKMIQLKMDRICQRWIKKGSKSFTGEHFNCF